MMMKGVAVRAKKKGEKNDVWVAWTGLGLDAATVWMVVGENGAAETKVAADDDDDDTGGEEPKHV